MGGEGARDDDAAVRKARGYVGEVLGGRYRVEQVLAFGGMGAVLKAVHVHMRRQVALKVLHPSTANLPELVLRFERESIVNAHLAHPNVCAAMDFGQFEDGSHYLVLEYVDGRSLRDVLRDGRMPARRAAFIARQLADALGAAHTLGIVHRDVKPGNVMVQSGERVHVKIVDFGLAGIPSKMFRADDDLDVTQAGTVFGTVAYMAPELAGGMHFVDARSDRYPLGVMLFEILAGVHPVESIAPTALFPASTGRRPCRASSIARRGVTPPPPALEGDQRVACSRSRRSKSVRESAEELIEALDRRGAAAAGRVASLCARRAVEPLVAPAAGSRRRRACAARTRASPGARIEQAALPSKAASSQDAAALPHRGSQSDGAPSCSSRRRAQRRSGGTSRCRRARARPSRSSSARSSALRTARPREPPPGLGAAPTEPASAAPSIRAPTSSPRRRPPPRRRRPRRPRPRARARRPGGVVATSSGTAAASAPGRRRGAQAARGALRGAERARRQTSRT